MTQPEQLEGQQVDQYTIQRHLDRGGMADVYLAYDNTLQRPVAMKMMLPQLARDDDYVARFRREATAVAGLHHPHIIQVYDVGVGPDERPYFTMQYVREGSLQRWLTQLQHAGQRMPVPFALALAVKIADALQTAHEAGIVHRDLKPANILLGTNSEPLLTDLGVARTGDTRLTQTGAAVGTPLYMAPEQMSGHADARSDIYAFGVMLHEMLAGDVPLQRPLPDSLLEETRTVVQRCLQPNPDDRFQSAAQLKAALAAALREERARTVDTRPMQAITQRLTSRHLLWAIPVLLLLFAFGAYLFFFAGPPGETAVASPSSQPVNLIVNEPAASPTSAPPASLVPTLTPLPTSTPTPTPSPTPTASPTPTITPTPTAVLPPLPQPESVEPTGQIVFTCYIDQRDDVCRMDANGSNEMRLTNTGATDYYASFFPDNQQIVFTSRRDNSFFMYAMNADGSNQRRLPPTNAGSIFAPTVSPDGTRIAFTGADNDAQHIWIINVDGTGLRRLTNEGENNVDPVWSPDGTQIAFASDRDGAYAHFVVDVASEEIRRIDTGIEEIGGRSDWSPDGRWLAFYAGDPGEREIYLAPITGGGAYRLTNGSGNLAPSFSPDGNWITFTSFQDGDGEIYIMRIDGTDLRQLTDNDYTDWQPRWSR